jgi:hypothetical protein
MHIVTQTRADGRKVRLLFPETTSPELLSRLSFMLGAMAQEQLEKGDDETPCPNACIASTESQPRSRS